MASEPKDKMPGIPGLAGMIEDFAADFAQRRKDIAEIQAKIKKTKTTATSDKRLLTVTVGPRGELKSLKFNSQDYRDLSSTELANLIVKTVDKARDSAMEKMSALIAPALPPGMNYEAIAGGRMDLASLLPENPLETVDLAAFLRRHQPGDRPDTT
jgi:DNA-binding protein YbaB